MTPFRTAHSLLPDSRRLSTGICSRTYVFIFTSLANASTRNRATACTKLPFNGYPTPFRLLFLGLFLKAWVVFASASPVPSALLKFNEILALTSRSLESSPAERWPKVTEGCFGASLHVRPWPLRDTNFTWLVGAAELLHVPVAFGFRNWRSSRLLSRTSARKLNATFELLAEVMSSSPREYFLNRPLDSIVSR